GRYAFIKLPGDSALFRIRVKVAIQIFLDKGDISLSCRSLKSAPGIKPSGNQSHISRGEINGQ
ncbi:MAG: hypothetical protein ABH969_06245, partial [Pseudomonadota bacterium]